MKVELIVKLEIKLNVTNINNNKNKYSILNFLIFFTFLFIYY